jgi:hypothetical protein
MVGVGRSWCRQANQFLVAVNPQHSTFLDLGSRQSRKRDAV